MTRAITPCEERLVALIAEAARGPERDGLFAVWLIVVLITGFVGLATMLAVASFPVYLLVVESQPSIALLTFGCAMTLFVCYTHRANIQRMMQGTENRVQRLWLFRPR